jgi:two-component system response regulator HydG
VEQLLHSNTMTQEQTAGGHATLTVVALSDSFRELWSELAEELAVPYQHIEAGEPVPPGAIAILVAAGGEEQTGLDYLLSRGNQATPPVYLIGSSESHRFAVEAVRRGAADYVSLPGDLDLLRRAISSLVEAARERQSGAHAQARAGFEQMIGDSPALRATLDKAGRILAHADVTVLIGGETGTGKEVLARAIHDGGPRAGQPFVAVNCAAIPANLIESELFGHARGAFTDAKQARAGLFEEAQGGTLFLDEIGHLPIHLQSKLLRALEEKQIRRVGENRDRSIDTRIIAATHVDLPTAVSQGEFRQDLFFRLNVVTLELPPLRERGEDMELLAKAFARTLAARYQIPVPDFPPDVISAIRGHSWPGNVRELRHAIERALLLSPPGTIDPAELTPTQAPNTGSPSGPVPFPATLKEISAAAVAATIEHCGGNKSAAARRLAISRARLQRLLDQEDDHET